MISYQQSGTSFNSSCLDDKKIDEAIGMIYFIHGSNLISFVTRFETNASSSSENNVSNHLLRIALTSCESTNKMQVDVPGNSFLKLEAENCMSRLYLLNDDAESLSYLFDIIEQSFANHDLLFVDALLSVFDPKKCKPILSTGLLRSTFRAKSSLTAWQFCASRVISYFNQKGENTQHLLRGLIRANDSITLSTTAIS